MKTKKIQAKTFFGMQYLEKDYWHFDEERLAHFEDLILEPRKNQKENSTLLKERLLFLSNLREKKKAITSYFGR